MIRSTFLLLAILLAAPRFAYSQCIDSSTAAQSNYYLLKGAEAREQLALCREYRKVDAEVIAQQDKIQAKLLDELVKRDDKYKRLRSATYALAALFLLSLLL
jgi:hypothetical protein